MKQLIVLMSTIMLGVFIYNTIIGNNDETVMHSISEMWKTGLEERSYWGR